MRTKPSSPRHSRVRFALLTLFVLFAFVACASQPIVKLVERPKIKIPRSMLAQPIPLRPPVSIDAFDLTIGTDGAIQLPANAID